MTQAVEMEEALTREPTADAAAADRTERLAPKVLGGIAVLTGVAVWAYASTLAELVATWDSVPDYSHGYLVVPVALFFLWARRASYPGFSSGLAWPGLALIGLSFVMRWVAARYWLEQIDGWSILVWIAGVVWLFGGFRLLWWSLPSIGFLWFMIPWPYRVEHALSLPLQRLATNLSCWTLQILGQPALAEGNTLLLGEHQLEVEQACSGLRIFVGIIALAFVYVVLARRSWWENVLILLSVVPVALVANLTRIVVTGLLYQHVSGEAARRFSHDVSGWLMIPLAAGLFALFLWYLDRLLPEVEAVDLRTVARKMRS
ncbi:MAG TPA: exosortase [Planctomycetaceae bacterium]|nr:exosortase [Planctomycetaceae bacterium]